MSLTDEAYEASREGKEGKWEVLERKFKVDRSKVVPFGLGCEKEWQWLTPGYRGGGAVMIAGEKFTSVEHYYLWRMFIGWNHKAAEKVRGLNLVAARQEANRVGLSEGAQMGQWRGLRGSVLYRALNAKFNQNGKLAKKLLDTGDALLVYVSSDVVLGVKKGTEGTGEGKEGLGKNMVGKLCMQIREELAEKVLAEEMDGPEGVGEVVGSVLEDDLPVGELNVVDEDEEYGELDLTGV